MISSATALSSGAAGHQFTGPNAETVVSRPQGGRLVFDDQFACRTESASAG